MTLKTCVRILIKLAWIEQNRKVMHDYLLNVFEEGKKVSKRQKDLLRNGLDQMDESIEELRSLLK